MAAPVWDVVVVGSCMIDLITNVARMPRMGETLQGKQFSIGFGGKGANQAVTASRLGAATAMVARLGTDVFGDMTLDNFREHCVDHRFVKQVDGAVSGIAPITVQEDGQNIVLIVPGANEQLDAEAVREAVELLRHARIVLCQLEIPVVAVHRAFTVAEQYGATTILNPAPARELPSELLELADVIVPNETELQLLTGVETTTLEGVARGARNLRRRADQTIIVTLGGRGAWVLERDEGYLVEAREVKAVDTTGAGDAFVGSLAYFLARGIPVRKAVRVSCDVATISVQRPGTQTSFPTLEDLKHAGIELPAKVS